MNLSPSQFIFAEVTKDVIGMRLAREPGARSGEQGKRERGAGIVVRNPEIEKFHQK
jgi:hypothetical protein